MKTSLFRRSAVAGLIATSLFALNALAGPGPQFWAQKLGTAPANPKPANACANCKDSAISVLVSAPAGGKGPSHYQRVGTKHSCATCGGAITTKDGKTTSDMSENCPVCSQAHSSCCHAS